MLLRETNCTGYSEQKTNCQKFCYSVKKDALTTSLSHTYLYSEIYQIIVFCFADVGVIFTYFILRLSTNFTRVNIFRRCKIKIICNKRANRGNVVSESIIYFKCIKIFQGRNNNKSNARIYKLLILLLNCRNYKTNMSPEEIEEIYKELDLEEAGLTEDDIIRRKRRIFVGGLKFASEDQVLFEHFAKFGEIKEAVVIRDRKTGMSKGYGFVSYKVCFVFRNIHQQKPSPRGVL